MSLSLKSNSFKLIQNFQSNQSSTTFSHFFIFYFSKTASPQAKKKGKENRMWGGGNVDAASLDYSSGGSTTANTASNDNDIVTERDVCIRSL